MAIALDIAMAMAKALSLLLRETVPLQTSHMGKKTVSVLAPSFLLP